MASNQIFHAVGKRKTSIARIYLQKGKGVVTVNSRPLSEYFDELNRFKLLRSLKTLGLESQMDVSVNVEGGGPSSQAEACMFGIAKALTLVDAGHRPELKKNSLLTRDARVVERKKYGHKKARKSFQFSKR
ncbi:MAG: 30S ribosomal protein S9 [Bradymonadales bacterium]|nr:MAG: 30S ribosomal protein S9 [Bradymonadales bacterium]